MINVLLLGSGGREHAFAWKIKQSRLLNKLYVAPGNAGTKEYGENINISLSDFKEIKKLVLLKAINMVVVGPEEPLVNGIHDFFLNDSDLKNVSVIGPQANGAILEGSKDFSKAFMEKYHIPTAKYGSFTQTNINEGFVFLESLNRPYVLKADGLAAGKGVLIVNEISDAKNELSSMLIDAKFGQASEKVVIEEFLDGMELSVFLITDGKSYKILPVAKDYKRVGDNDTGLNTGGMGAISPVAFANAEFMEKVEKRIIEPTLEGLNKEGILYKGFLFIGLMNVKGEPYVIEYNCRMGDPETEVVIPRIESDILELFVAVTNGNLSDVQIKIDPQTAVTVMLVSYGYPEKYEKEKEITGIEKVKDGIVFHSGTKLEKGKVLTNGGRVIAVTTLGKDINEAIVKAYKNVDLVNFENKYYRKDIGADLKKISKILN